jgi:hypothetical protein
MDATDLNYLILTSPFSLLFLIHHFPTMDHDQAMTDAQTDPRIVRLQEEIADLRLQLGLFIFVVERKRQNS